MDKNMSSEQLMDWIMCLGFCADDMKLYLDTHPDDMNALDYYNQCVELLDGAKKSYEMKNGPLCLQSAGPVKNWDWNCGRMPWDGGRR